MNRNDNIDSYQTVRGEQKPVRFHCLATMTLRLTPVTLKLKGGLDMLKMYPHTENEAASLRYSKLGAWVEKDTKICLSVKGQGQNVESSRCVVSIK